MLNFESLPKDKPSQNNIVEGTYKATIFKTEMRVSKETNNEFLNVFAWEDLDDLGGNL